MAGVLQHLRSSTLNKRPNPASMVDGQIAINYASGSPGAFFKDSNGNLVKVGPVHVGATAPNVSPASGGTAGNSLGEQWLDTSGGTYVFKIWDGAAWRSEAGEFVNVTGDTMTGSLTMGPSANLIFEGSTDDGFETTLTVVDPTADRTITLPNISGTVVTTGDSGTVTSTMIADGTIVNGDVSASAAIAGTKISPDFGSQNVVTTGTSTAASFIPTSSTAPSNGIYLPSANNVAISASGTGRLFVDSAGFVGVGTDSPAELLETQGGNIQIRNSLTLAVNTLSPYGLTFRNANQLGQDRGTIAAIKPYLAGASDNDFGLQFQTQATTAGGVTTKMTLTPGGSLGIGTTSPAVKLTARDSNESGIVSVAAIENYITINPSSGNGVAFDFNLNNNGNATVNRGRIAVVNTSFHAESEMRFYTATSNAIQQRMVLDSSGRLLVGTSSARTNFYNGPDTAIFQIEGALNNIARFSSFTYGRANSDGPIQIFAKHRSNGIGGTTLVSSGDEIGRLSFQGGDGTEFVEGARIEALVDGTPGANNMPGRLVFSTTADGESSPTERMRIGNSGTARLFTSNYGLLLGNSQSAGTTYTAFEIYAGSTNTTSLGTLTLQIYNNGNVQNTNNSYGAISDVKLKENIVDATSQWSDIKALQVRKYNFKEGQTHTQIGLVAQEVELVSPGLVTESPDRDAEGNDLGTVTKSVNYSVLYMKAVKALQEAMERIELLEARLNAANL